MNESSSGLLDGDGSTWKIDPEPIIPQKVRTDQDRIAFNKGRLRTNRPTIKWEVDKEDIFLDLLIGCQKGYYTAYKPCVHVQA